MAWTCPAPFYPNHTNYMTDREHNGNVRKSWFLVLRAGLFTKWTDAEHQADVSGAPVFTFHTCAEADKRETPVKDEVEEAKTPLFREDSEASPLSRACKRPSPASSPSSRRRRTSASAHSVLSRVPGPNTSPTRPSSGMSVGSISSVLSLSASVGSSASRAAPPLCSLPQHPPSSRPAATHLHAGGSPSTGVQSRRHAEAARTVQ
ncbi:hypothetical protein B0H14DRAFT_737647 [Mycena olivaceomarginata]|nr:hypothetical protein B0H14DRAFT_737647 [Mycena olivaceomarginata]